MPGRVRYVVRDGGVWIGVGQADIDTAAVFLLMQRRRMDRPGPIVSLSHGRETDLLLVCE